MGWSLLKRKKKMQLPAFIRPIHPKTEINPDPPSIEKVLKLGWWGQTKIHGHRAQIHLHADPNVEPVAYTRSGKIHSKDLEPSIVSELRRVFKPQLAWSVVDVEWLKKEQKLYIFDYLKKDDKVLVSLSYRERYNLIPRDFISPHIEVLSILKNLNDCLAVLQDKRSWVEGLVFKSPNSYGFSDSSVVKCRKPQFRY